MTVFEIFGQVTEHSPNDKKIFIEKTLADCPALARQIFF